MTGSVIFVRHSFFVSEAGYNGVIHQLPPTMCSGTWDVLTPNSQWCSILSTLNRLSDFTVKSGSKWQPFMASTIFFSCLVCVLSNFRSLSSSGGDEVHRNSVGLLSMKTDCSWSGRGKVRLLRQKRAQKEYKGRVMGHRATVRERLTLRDHS